MIGEYRSYRNYLNYRSGTVSWFSPTLKGSLSSGVCPPIGRSGLCPSDRRLRCVGPRARSFFAGGGVSEVSEESEWSEESE